MYAEPAILIVDDEEESLWSVPYTISGDDVEFGEPVQIKVQYVEEESGKVAAARMSAALNIVNANELLDVTAEQVYEKAALSRPDDRKPPKEAKMGLDTPALRERLGLTAEQLPDDATEEQINAAIAAKPEPAVADEKPDDKPELEAETETAPATTAASSTVTVDREAWEATQRTQAELKADLETRTKATRDEKVNAAAKAGKFPPSRKEHYVKLMEADPEGTEALLDSMEPGVIPVNETEFGSADADGTGGAATSAAYDESWLTDSERARVKAAREGDSKTPRLVLEG